MGDVDNEEKYTTSELANALELYNNAPCGSISFFKNGNIYAINNTMLTWLGYERDEIVNKKTLPSLFKIGGQIFFETHFFPLIKMQGFVNEVYFDIVRKDKSILHALINARETPTKDGASEIYQATILDISDRWKYEMELLKAKKKAEHESKVKADLLATISHEIRTPLNSILGIGNLLHATPLNENQKKYARLLLHSSEHLLSLVNNLLDFSKIEAQKVQLEKVSFHLGDLVEMLRETFRVKAEEKGITLELDISKDVSHNLIGDPVKLNQILTNLIGNAIKFTKVGGVTLAISLAEKKSPKEHVLKFKITDTGMGIPKEKLETIFQEFSQASYEVSVEFGGTGLGLTICQKLLELHNSKMELKSKQGKGSCFHFSICYTLDSKASPKREIQSKLSDIRKLKNFLILVVDDNPNNIFIATQYLDQWNISYKTANSGKKALALVKKYSFDVILLDLQMPEMSGYETAEHIRAIETITQPFIIAFSASAKGDVAKELIRHKIDDYLPKPFQPKELVEVILKYNTKGKSKKPSIKSSEILKTKIENKSPKKEAPLIKAAENKEPSFTLTRYKKMANNKSEFLNKFKASTHDAMISYKKDFNDAIKENNVEALSNLIHQSTMSLYYIDANRLSSYLKSTRELLTENPVNKKQLQQIVQDCNNEFDIITAGLA